MEHVKKTMTKARFGQDRDRVKRVPFGLGDAPSPDALQKTLRCGFGNVPVVEEVVWTIPLPLTEAEAQSTFGDIINVLTSQANVPGVASIDSTFLLNGILQTDLYTQGVGVHVFCEPMQLATIGNGWTSPATPAAPPASPDVFTLNDVAASALGLGAGQTLVPASFDWGGEVWRAGWNFINAYQFQWKTSQRELVLNELAADISYFGSFADAAASGTSEVPIIEFVATANATYRSKGSTTIFVPVTHRLRQLAHPSKLFEQRFVGARVGRRAAHGVDDHRQLVGFGVGFVGSILEELSECAELAHLRTSHHSDSADECDFDGTCAPSSGR